MRFGLALPHYDFSVPGERASFATAAAWAGEAERLGFDSVWISDHFFYSFARYGAPDERLGSLEPLTALAGIAVTTDRVRLGTLVLGAPFRHPSLLAKTVATIDLLSGGRFDLGLGAGWYDAEFEAFGFASGTVGERFAELEGTLQVLDALFRDEPVTMRAGSVALKEARMLPRPAQTPRPPIWVGGKGGERLLSLAARYADGWNSVWRWSPDAYAERAGAARRACERVGRDPATFRLSVGLYGLIAEDDRALADLWVRARRAMPGGALDGESLEGWCADTLSGTPDRVRERVSEWAAAGVEEIVLSPWVLPFAVPERDQVALFAERVIAPLRATA
jgi:probable F420-dependent oxidoreductase